MRKITELSSCIRGMVLGGHDWGKAVSDAGVFDGTPGKMVPNALAVLAAAESRFMFLLVKLSGCRDNTGDQDEPCHQARPSAVSGTYP